MEKEIINLYKIMNWTVPKGGWLTNSGTAKGYRDELSKKSARLKIYREQMDMYYFDELFEGTSILTKIENCIRTHFTPCFTAIQGVQHANVTIPEYQKAIKEIVGHEDAINKVLQEAAQEHKVQWEEEKKRDEDRKAIRALIKSIQSLVDTNMSTLFTLDSNRKQFVLKQKELDPSFDESISKTVEGAYKKILSDYKVFQNKEASIIDSLYERNSPLKTHIQNLEATKEELKKAISDYIKNAEQVVQRSQERVMEGIPEGLQSDVQRLLASLSGVSPSIQQDFVFQLQQHSADAKKCAEILGNWEKKLKDYVLCKSKLEVYRDKIKDYPRMVPIKKCNTELLTFETALYQLNTEQLLSKIDSCIQEVDVDINPNFHVEEESDKLIKELGILEQHMEQLAKLQEFTELAPLKSLYASTQLMIQKLSDSSTHINKTIQNDVKQSHTEIVTKNNELKANAKEISPFKESLFAPIHGNTKFPDSLSKSKILKGVPEDQKELFEGFVEKLEEMKAKEKTVDKKKDTLEKQQKDYEKALEELKKEQKNLPEIDLKIEEYNSIIAKANTKITELGEGDSAKKKKYEDIIKRAKKKKQSKEKEQQKIKAATNKKAQQVEGLREKLDQTEQETLKEQQELEKVQFEASCTQVEVLMNAKVEASSELSQQQWEKIHSEWKEACGSAMENMNKMASDKENLKDSGNKAVFDSLGKKIDATKKGWEAIVQRKSPLDAGAVELLKQKVTTMRELSLSTTLDNKAGIQNLSLDTLREIIKEEIRLTSEFKIDHDYETDLASKNDQESLMTFLEYIKSQRKQQKKDYKTNVDALSLIIGQIEPLLEIALESESSIFSYNKELKRAIEDIRQEAKQYSAAYIQEISKLSIESDTFKETKGNFKALLQKTIDFTTNPSNAMEEYKKIDASVQKLKAEFKKAKVAQKTFPEFYNSIDKQLMNIESSLDQGNIEEVKEKIIRTQILLSSLFADYATFQNEHANLEGLYTNCEERLKALASSLKEHEDLSKKIKADLEDIKKKKSKIKTLGEQQTTFNLLKKVKEKLVEIETNPKSIATYEDLIHREADHQKALEDAWTTLKAKREEENKEIQAFTLNKDANTKSEKKRLSSLKKQAKNALKSGKKLGDAKDYQNAKNQLDIIPQILRLLKENPDGVNASALKNLDKINELWLDFRKKWTEEATKSKTNIATLLIKMSKEASTSEENENKQFLEAAQKSFEKEYSNKIDAINAHLFAEDFSIIIAKIQNAQNDNKGKLQTKALQLVQEKQTYLQSTPVKFITQNPFSPISVKPFKKLLRKIEITFLTAMPK